MVSSSLGQRVVGTIEKASKLDSDFHNVREIFDLAHELIEAIDLEILQTANQAVRNHQDAGVPEWTDYDKY